MMLLDKAIGAELLGWTKESISKVYLGDGVDHAVEREPEIVYFKRFRAFGVQGHPEWLSYTHPLTQYTLNTFARKANVQSSKATKAA